MNNTRTYIPLSICDCGSDAEITHKSGEDYICGCKDCNVFIKSHSVTQVVNDWNNLHKASIKP